MGTRLLTTMLVVLTALSGIFYFSAHTAGQAFDQVTNRTALLPTPAGLAEPVPHFLDRAPKKPFGIFITPETSPIDRDYHTGYHTGMDVEFTDTTDDVPVSAIADGIVVFRDWVKGYGGVIVIRHTLNGIPVYALYGHLDQNSFLSSDITHVTAGQQIAILGDDHSSETDGVRKHLHFSISTTETLNLRGYVQTEAELTHWLDPLSFYAIAR